MPSENLRSMAVGMKRVDGRAADELRPVRIDAGVQGYAEGSALIEAGETRVLCAVSVEETVPRWLRGSGRGWVTAEYAMLPRSTLTRTPRERNAGGRSREIQRLIGRSLRAVVDLDALGQRMFTVDCDVLQADGGTRTAAVTGAYVALHEAARALVSAGKLKRVPFRAGVAAVSVGLVDGAPLLDLCYEEDARADADVNVVMTDAGDIVEVQGTAETAPFSRETLDAVLDLAWKGVGELVLCQRAAIEGE